jgi:hypothetical protein
MIWNMRRTPRCLHSDGRNPQTAQARWPQVRFAGRRQCWRARS